MMCGKFAFEDTLVACGYSDGIVRVYNINTENRINEIHTNTTSEKTPVNTVKWRPLGGDLGSISSVILTANTDGHLFQCVSAKRLSTAARGGTLCLGLAR